MSKVKNLSNVSICFDVAVEYMDDEIRENVHSDIAPCSEQEFMTAYENKHIEKLGKYWFLSEEDALTQI